KFEIRAQDYGKAVTMFRALSRSPDTRVRAVALLRLGRNLRKMGRADEALRAYDELAHLDSERVAGLPADFAGRRAGCVALDELGREDGLRAEARLLEGDLVAGRWPLDRGAFLQYASELETWLGEEAPVPSDRAALAEAVNWLWRQQTEM